MSLALQEPDLMDRAEAAIAENFERVELPVTHHFFRGAYGRELFIPAGTKLTGKIHKGKTLNILSKGVIAVYSKGEPARILEAPFVFVSEPGARRLGIAKTDTTWICIHFTEKTDLAELENELIEPHINPLLQTKETIT